ncbi:hypothetical protein [Domibacillus robiginosus]|uniref:hypothetical protein n=1 Tax=Domibacillus robiginosus TaxID=1071054 RepID=UPI00067AD5DC|nr:hypothetical protein [Domibacillus robiginosus]
MNLSSFSIEHTWKLNWTKVPEYIKPFKYVNNESPKEKRALEALACIGVIGGLQLSRLFFLDKKRKKKMVLEKKLVRHDIQKNNQVIPIYTLGINGAKAIDMPGYENNYWLKINIEDMLGKLLFFQLYEWFPGSRISPAVNPFEGVIFYKNKPIYIYSAKEDIQDLLVFLKWKEFSERMIVITESLKHLEGLLHYDDIRIRAILQQDVHSARERLGFYIKSGSEWVEEQLSQKSSVNMAY